MEEKQDGEIIAKRVKKERKKDLFEVLDETGIPHAICINVQEMKLKTIYDVSKQWFILIPQSEKKRIHGYGFKNSEGRHDVAERDLTEEEIAYFKKNQNDYLKILHNRDGRIYELKGNSLSKFIDNE